MMAVDVVGRGWAFPACFRAPNSGPDVEDGDALIQQSLYLLLNTQTGERALNAEFGSGLYHFMFQELSPLALTELKQEIATAILEHEPRIKLLSIEFDTQRAYEGLLNIVLEYSVKQTNARSNMVFPFYISEKSV